MLEELSKEKKSREKINAITGHSIAFIEDLEKLESSQRKIMKAKIMKAKIKMVSIVDL